MTTAPFRFSLLQLLMAIAVAGIVICLTQSGGCGGSFLFVRQVTFSPDGRQLAVCAFNGRRANVPGKLYVADLCRTVYVIDLAASSHEVIEQELKTGVQGPLFSAIGPHPSLCYLDTPATLAYCGWDGQIQAWDFVENGPTNRVGESWPGLGNLWERIGGFAFSSDQKWLAVGNRRQVVFVERGTAYPLRQVEVSVAFRSSPSMAFSRNGRTLAIGAEDEVVCWSPQSESAVCRFRLASEVSGATVACSAEGNQIAIVDDTSGLCVWEPKIDSVRRLDVDSPFGEPTFDSTGQYLGVASNRGVYIFDTKNGEWQSRILNCQNARCLAFSHDGRSLATGHFGGKVSIWNLADGNLKDTFLVDGQYRVPVVLPVVALAIWCAACALLCRRGRRRARPADVAA